MMIEEILAPSKDTVRKTRGCPAASTADRPSHTSNGLLTWKQPILLHSAERGSQISRFFYLSRITVMASLGRQENSTRGGSWLIEVIREGWRGSSDLWMDQTVMWSSRCTFNLCEGLRWMWNNGFVSSSRCCRCSQRKGLSL